MRRRIRKGLAMLLTATMVVGLMPGAGTIKVSAEEGEVSGSAATAEGYDADGFCTGYKFDESGNWVKDESSSTPCTHKECNGYQPANKTTGTYEVDGDSNTNDEVYEISNAGQLYWFADKVNNDYSTYVSANAVLTGNITVNTGVLDENGDLNTGEFRSWTPIGGYYNTTVLYNGIFDGNHNTISGLYYNESSKSSSEVFYVGLFGGNEGTIKNVGIVDSYFRLDSISGYAFWVGGLCGNNHGTIENCDNEATVTVTGTINEENTPVCVGGVCGNNTTDEDTKTGIIKNCKNAGKVSSAVSTGTELSVGGVCGITYCATIENCYNEGKVTGTKNVGGVCGYNEAEDGETAIITNCYNTNTVSGTENVGGVCGQKSSSGTATITNCYYLDTTLSDANATAKTATEFANGSVCYLLNGEESEGTDENPLAWYQNLPAENGDASPVLDSTHGVVYQCTPCTGVYSNTSGQAVAHIFEKVDDEQHKCKNCGLETVHSTETLTYTADEDTNKITVKCGDDCGKEYGTISLSAPSGTITYDGNVKEAGISTNVTGVTISEPTITYKQGGNTLSSAPTDAGEYTASITLGTGESAATVSVEYTIARRPVTITAYDVSKTYGEPDPELLYTVSEDTPLVDSEELSGELSRLTGENAGTYTITQGTVTKDGNPNYDITFNEGTLTIGKANTNGTANCEMVLQYDETSGNYTATITNVENAEYKFGESGEWNSNNTLTEIAHNTTVTGYIRIAGDENHEPGSEDCMTLISGHGTMTHYEAKAPDCVNDGNWEYWYCESCKKYFSDAEGTTETTKDAVTNGTASGHKWDTATYMFDATHHWHNCQNENCPITDNSLKEGYGEHVDSNNDGICEDCQKRIWYIVSPSSMLLERGDSVSNISMNPVDGKVKVGEKVTVTTKDMLGYRFMGWYLKSNINKYNQLLEDVTPQSTSFTYTFTPEDNMSLVAVYEAAGNAEVKISGSGFKVSVAGVTESAEQDGTYTGSVAIGSEVTITIVDGNVEFISWTNESNKIVSTDRIYPFTVTGNTTLTMSKKGTAGSTAMVEFVSAYNQVIAGRIYGSSETITFPDGPSKMGCNFKGWSLTQDEIHQRIKDGEAHITVTPVYEQDTAKTYTVTVYVDEVQDSSQTATGILAGTTKTVKAPTVDGKVFLYWTDADGNILGYDASYFMQINKDIVVKAVYGEEAVDVKPVIAMTNVFTTSTGGMNKISFTVTRDIPEGYTLVEHGVLYNKDGTIANPTKDTFVLGGTYVSKYTATTTKLSGVVTLNVNMTGVEDTKVVTRGYMIVKNSEGKDEIYYSDIAHTSYNDKKQEGDN